MFERFDFDEMEKRSLGAARQLAEQLPDEYQFSARDLLPVVTFAEMFSSTALLTTFTLGREVPQDKMSLGYLGGMFGCFCQDHNVPAERHTDYLHAFYISIFNEPQGSNLLNNFLYLYTQEDAETYDGMEKGLEAYTNFEEQGLKAFLSFAILHKN